MGVTVKKRVLAGTAVAVLLAVVPAGCGSEKSICQEAEEAETCLVKRTDTRYDLEAKGFQPNTDLRVALAGARVPTTVAGAEPTILKVDDDGRYPGKQRGTSLVVPEDAGSVEVRVAGVTAAGKTVTLIHTIE